MEEHTFDAEYSKVTVLLNYASRKLKLYSESCTRTNSGNGESTAEIFDRSHCYICLHVVSHDKFTRCVSGK